VIPRRQAVPFSHAISADFTVPRHVLLGFINARQRLQRNDGETAAGAGYNYKPG
jgi:hypothetical protein